MDKGWINVEDELPPEDDKWYPILDSDRSGDFIQGKIIVSDFKGRRFADDSCVITHWLNHPIPDKE